MWVHFRQVREICYSLQIYGYYFNFCLFQWIFCLFQWIFQNLTFVQLDHQIAKAIDKFFIILTFLIFSKCFWQSALLRSLYTFISKLMFILTGIKNVVFFFNSTKIFHVFIIKFLSVTLVDILFRMEFVLLAYFLHIFSKCWVNFFSHVHIYNICICLLFLLIIINWQFLNLPVDVGFLKYPKLLCKFVGSIQRQVS